MTPRESSDNLRGSLLQTSHSEPSHAQLQKIGKSSEAALADMLTALSTQWAGQSLFSGTATDRAPTPDMDTLLNSFISTLPPNATATEIFDAAEQFFDDDTGHFQTTLYAGGPPRKISSEFSGEYAEFPTALDPALRGALRNFALGAILGMSTTSITLSEKQQMAQKIISQSSETSTQLINLQGRLGGWQDVMHNREESLLAAREQEEGTLRNLVGVDPYEAAVRMEDTRAKLELLYSVTARVTRLSLVDYL